ncbi:hypothetical protein R3P38DRAFT_2785678 [Favolaschia claudopus]|uniref:Uncharacterized protein n=1 Tax=Favolaschia claudopus TaxID=2862362 RepID=A0AAW0AUB6_9AGAR
MGTDFLIESLLRRYAEAGTRRDVRSGRETIPKRRDSASDRCMNSGKMAHQLGFGVNMGDFGASYNFADIEISWVMTFAEGDESAMSGHEQMSRSQLEYIRKLVDVGNK